jgi:probable F420-dependent oxidoreductase
VGPQSEKEARVAHDRRFRFGVAVTNAEGGDAFALLARRAEDCGYSTLFVPDHFVDHPFAPIPALAAAAAVTTTLRIGPLVLGNDYKHPVVLAREAATLDVLSNGRLELGIGAGWMTADYEKSGIPLDPARVRISRLEESITVLKGLFADGPFSFDGVHYQINDLDGQPKPVQRPHPPFIIGGGGPRILGVAAREAEIVGVNALLRSGLPTSEDSVRSLTPAATDQKLAWLRDTAGDRFDDLELQTLVGFVLSTDDRESIGQGMAAAFGVAAEDALAAPVALVGTQDQMIEALEARRERWQISYVVVPSESLESFAPIVARLAGK